MGEIKQQFVPWDKFTPDFDIPLILQTKHGVREAVYRYSLFPRLLATDCTHPMQNMNMMGCVIGWKYADDNYALNGGYHINHWARQMEGEEILGSVIKNKKRPLLKFINKIKWLWS